MAPASGSGRKRSIRRDSNVGLSKFRSLEEKLFPGFPSQSISHAVTKVKLRGVVTFAVTCKCVSGNAGLCFREGDNRHAKTQENEIKISDCI